MSYFLRFSRLDHQPSARPGESDATVKFAPPLKPA